MKTGGIIAEYNPFHNGHRYLIEKYREIHGVSHVVVAMSGNFVQRGGPAIFDKYMRTEMALSSGADLVIEIPAYFATQTAELYARGAVMALDSLSCLDSICFGSEYGDIEDIRSVAHITVNRREEYESNIRLHMEKNMPYAAAREKSIRMFLNDIPEDFLKAPNNILAVEYVRELARLGSDIEPVTVKRLSVGHNDMESAGEMASATFIRKEIFNNKGDIRKFIPGECFRLIEKFMEEGGRGLQNEDFFDIIAVSVLQNEKNLSDFFEISEGLENSIRSRITKSLSFDDIVKSLTTKRYSSSRIRRCLYNVMLGVRKEKINKIKNIESLPYIRVLGFNRKGTEILRDVRENASAQVVMGLSKAMKSEGYRNDRVFRYMMDFDLKTSNIYYQKYYSGNRSILAKGEPDFINMIRAGL